MFERNRTQTSRSVSERVGERVLNFTDLHSGFESLLSTLLPLFTEIASLANVLVDKRETPLGLEDWI
jgi:hypothetical protein